MNPSRFGRRLCCPLAAALTSVLFTVLAWTAAAQEPEVPETPNQEPAATDQLFGRSDLGNVVQTARMHYHQGVRDLQRGESLERKAGQSDDAQKRRNLERKSIGAYESARRSFLEALSYEPDLVEAYAGLGAAFRHLGDNEEALELHANALRRWPESTDNFRGWVESLLALNMLGNATSAYSTYAQTQPARAEILLTEMKEWLVEKRNNPGDLDPADIERLASWVEQQERGSE